MTDRIDSGLSAVLRRRGQATVWVVSLSMVAAILLFHHLSGSLLDLYVLFLAPSLLAAWFLGLRGGALVTLASGLGWLYSDLTLKDAIPLWANIANNMARLFIFLVLVWLVHRIHVLTEQLLSLSRTDGLTGLANRRAFLDRGELEVRRAQRNEAPLSVMFIDLDNFKLVNDTHGHEVGDELLRGFGEILRGSIRATDLAARLGGDEFAVVLPETTGTEAIRVSEKLKAQAAATLAGLNLPVSLSIGIATFNREPPPFEAALRCADHLMYEVKEAGKNAILQKDLS